MTKNTRFTKKTRLQKQTYTQWKCPENALQCNANHKDIHIVQLIVNQRQRKQKKIAATLVVVCTGHW